MLHPAEQPDSVAPPRFVRDGDNLLTAEQVAEVLGMGVVWVYAQTRAKKIPHVRLGRFRRYRARSIEAWLAELEGEVVSDRGRRSPQGA